MEKLTKYLLVITVIVAIIAIIAAIIFALGNRTTELPTQTSPQAETKRIQIPQESLDRESGARKDELVPSPDNLPEF